MKIRIFLIALFISFNFIIAQKVKLKNEKISIDGKEVLKYEKIDMNNIVLYPIDKDSEIIQISRMDNETNDIGDDYVKFYFIESKLKLESNSIGRRGWEYYIEWLVKNKVIDSDGILNKERVEQVVSRFDENITVRTVHLK